MPLTITRRPGTVRRAASLTLAIALVAHTAAAEARQESTSSVKVHGHWTIEVRNPDGTLAEHREFENALIGSGASVLAKVLARVERAGVWMVQLLGVGPCSIAGGVASECIVIEAPPPANPPTLTDPFYLFRNLTVTVPTSGPNLGRVVLAGHATATSSDGGLLINKVATWQNTCELPTGVCYGSSFSEKSIPPLPVVKGQIIQVTVVLSFH